MLAVETSSVRLRGIDRPPGAVAQPLDLTGTFDAQAPKPSLTVTKPVAITCLRRSRVIVRSCVVAPAVTVKLVALVPVPVGFVTEIGPVEAPSGTVALMWVLLVTL